MNKNSVAKRRLGKTNLQVSVLGFGSAPIGYLKTDVDRVGRILNLLLDNGVNLIDTAANYPGSEEVIGKSISHRRDEFFIVSKCGTKVSGTTGSPWSADLITQTVDRSLKALNVEVLDVMLLHSCDLATLQRGEALGALVKAREAGKIRFLGYSGDNEAAAFAVAQPDIAVLETSVNIADQLNVDLVLPATESFDVGVLAKRPVCNAAWKKIDAQEGLYKNYAKVYTDRFEQMGLNPQDLGFTGDWDTVWPQIALRFTLGFSQVHAAIVGSTNPLNVEANLAFAAKGPMPEAAIKAIRAAFHRAQADSGTTWTGQT